MMKRRSSKILFAVAVAAALCSLAGTASAQSCVGINCGANDPGFHCHSTNAQGNQCWDRFDNSCESLAGFSASDPGVSSCALNPSLTGAGVAVGSQVATLGGFNQFRGQVVRRATPAIEAADPGEDDEEQGGFYISEIVAAAEYEQWDIFGLEGETTGLRMSWNRATENSHIFGISGSYQEAEPDFGATTELLDVNATYGREFGSMWTWGVSVNLSDLGGFVDSQFYGAGGHVAFASYRDNGHVFSGGVIARFSTSNEDIFDEDTTTLGAGVAYGLPLGQRVTLDVDAYAINLIDPEVNDDLFFLIGAQAGFYLTPRLTLHLGYRTLEGIDDLKSDTLTLGFASRWD